MDMSESGRLFRKAQKVIAGGVNSPVRALNAVGSSPVFIEEARGPYLYDADGNRYIDYCLSWGPMILGHARKEVLEEVRKVLSKGTSFGIPTGLETQLAELISGAIKSVEQVRLVSSGTEAVMTAIRLARGYTGREKIIKFTGCYHGHVDHLLVQAGSGAMTLGVPGSPGVPRSFTKHTIAAPYNDAERVKDLFRRYSGKIAAVIVEPVAGNMGVIPPGRDFLKTIRELCNREGAILIFDEVITGFRAGFGSMQEKFGVQADVTCLGKIIGGGFPIGACGGKAEYMKSLAPVGEVYQAGTLSGNPVCVAAGIATLKTLKREKPYARLERLTGQLCGAISDILAKGGVEHTINNVGSMFTLFFNRGPVTDYISAGKSDTKRFARYFRGMLKSGVYLPPSQFESCFLSTAHTERHIEETVGAIRRLQL